MQTLFRFNTLLLTIFGAIALALSLIGTYGVVSYSVGQRTKEFGIRVALSAEPRNIFKLVLSKGATLIVIGLGLGFAVSFPAVKFLARSLKESMNLDLMGDWTNAVHRGLRFNDTYRLAGLHRAGAASDQS